MISYAVKGLDNSPVAGSTLLLFSVYILSVAPNFTRDIYLKILPVLLIAPIMISSSDFFVPWMAKEI